MPPTPVAAPSTGSTARGVVVGLDLEGDSPAVADVDHARVFARPWSTRGPVVGNLRRRGLRVLVAAVLAPHRAGHAQLDLVGRAAKHAAELAVFVAGEAYFGE